MSNEPGLRHTPLYKAHLSLGARMVPFGGWEMPVQYAGILAECDDTRRRVTVFDTSHMGEFFIDGDPVRTGLDRVVTQSLLDMPPMACRYGVMLNEGGGVIDDLIVYRLAEAGWMVVVNGGTLDKDAAHFRGALTCPGCFVDRSFETGKLDVQGPLSRDILRPIVEGIDRLGYYTCGRFNILGENVLISRTGYTGELGYEIYYPWEKSELLWNKILEQARPAGLGARDVLRVEMGYSLYGHELSEDISPLESGLGRFIAWNKDFIGKASLVREKQSGSHRKCICFVGEGRRPPRDHHRIFDSEGMPIGQVTSGVFSPELKRGIGLGMVERSRGGIGEKVYFGDGTQNTEAIVVRRPAYPGGSLRD